MVTSLVAEGTKGRNGRRDWPPGCNSPKCGNFFVLASLKNPSTHQRCPSPECVFLICSVAKWEHFVKKNKPTGSFLAVQWLWLGTLTAEWLGSIPGQGAKILQSMQHGQQTNKQTPCMLSCFSCIQLFVTLWSVAHQAPLSTGIPQARILQWVSMPSSRGSSQPRDWTCVSYVSRIGRWVLYHGPHWGNPNKNPMSGNRYFQTENLLFSTDR